MTYKIKENVCAFIMLTCCFFSIESAAAREHFDDFLPEVRRGLFLHFCDTIHNRQSDSSHNLIDAEVDHHKMTPLNTEESARVSSLCLRVFDIKFKQKQREQSSLRSWLTAALSFTRSLSSSTISAADRASVFALSAENGDQFVLTRADQPTHLIFCQQTYDHRDPIDAVWPFVYRVLQSTEPSLLSDWRGYSSAHKSCCEEQEGE